MPRIRSIKHEFFINEDLATVSSDARLLAMGLATIADKAGRLEDRPIRIKASLFPYHSVDVDALLGELSAPGVGFIERYVVDGKRYISIVNFSKHQHPHPKEPESTIPEPCKATASNGKPRRAVKHNGGPRKAHDEPGDHRNDHGDLDHRKSIAAQARSVFAFWQEHLNHPRSIFDSKRERAVTARLKDGFTVEQLKTAVRGCKLTPFNMGQNDRHTVYDDIQIICESAKNVERFIAATENRNEVSQFHQPRTASERNVVNIEASLEYLNSRREDRPPDSQEQAGLLTSESGP